MLNAHVSSDAAISRGYVRLIKSNANGEVIYDQTHKNQLTFYARSSSAKLWTGAYNYQNTFPVPSQIQVGTGAPTAPKTSVDPSDTALWTPMANTLKVLDYPPQVWMTYNTQYAVTYGQSEAVGDWTELGLFDSGPNLWSHIQLSNFTKASGESVTVQWSINHVGN